MLLKSLILVVLTFNLTLVLANQQKYQLSKERFKKSTNPACSKPPQSAPCKKTFLISFYYDQNKKSCKQVLPNTSCGEFGTREECERNCGKLTREEICNLPSEVGFCRAHLRKFYFNKSSGACEEFVYGGCGGNSNRFGSLEECKSYCIDQKK